MELGIRLALKGEANDRLQVDAPKGALNSELRDLLTANKSDLIAALRAQAAARDSQTETSEPAITLTQESSRTTPQSPEPKPLILEHPFTKPIANTGRVEVEVNNLLAGRD